MIAVVPAKAQHFLGLAQLRLQLSCRLWLRPFIDKKLASFKMRRVLRCPVSLELVEVVLQIFNVGKIGTFFDYLLINRDGLVKFIFRFVKLCAGDHFLEARQSWVMLLLNHVLQVDDVSLKLRPPMSKIFETVFYLAYLKLVT